VNNQHIIRLSLGLFGFFRYAAGYHLSHKRTGYHINTVILFAVGLTLLGISFLNREEGLSLFHFVAGLFFIILAFSCILLPILLGLYQTYLVTKLVESRKFDLTFSLSQDEMEYSINGTVFFSVPTSSSITLSRSGSYIVIHNPEHDVNQTIPRKLINESDEQKLTNIIKQIQDAPSLSHAEQKA
jgi:hypothetical protein